MSPDTDHNQSPSLRAHRLPGSAPSALDTLSHFLFLPTSKVGVIVTLVLQLNCDTETLSNRPQITQTIRIKANT